MKWLSRLLGRDVDEARSAPPPPGPTTVDAPSGVAFDVDAILVAPDEHAVRAALVVARREGIEAPALARAAAWLERHVASRLRREVALALSARGDTEPALRVLETAPPDEPCDAAMLALAGELRERIGDREGARAAYERALVHDIDFAVARERLVRLRPTNVVSSVEGATLVGSATVGGGRFRLERELGRGGAGAVYLAWDARCERRVALKIHHEPGPTSTTRCLHEAAMAARFEHPSIVRILDVDPDVRAIAMEWLRAGSTRDAARNGLEETRLASWLRTAADALALVHAEGIVHGDLKPTNLLVRGDDRVVLADFGLARPAFERIGPDEGTPAYLAPEIRSGEPAGPAIDVFALGLAFTELSRALPTPISAPLARVLASCTEEDPHARPAAASLVALLA